MGAIDAQAKPKAKKRPSRARMRCPGCGRLFFVSDDVGDPDRLLEAHATGDCRRPDRRLMIRIGEARQMAERLREERHARRGR